jgi:hypothetical protein
MDNVVAWLSNSVLSDGGYQTIRDAQVAGFHLRRIELNQYRIPK